MEKLQYFCNVIWNYSQKNIPLEYFEKRLSGIIGDEYKPILEILLNWDFLNPPVCAIISNQNGIGKSHLASAMIRQYVKKYVTDNYDNFLQKYEEEENKEYFFLDGLKLGFVPERTILREIRDCYKSKYGNEQAIFTELCSYSILVIDDIFSSKESGDKDFSRRTILDLMNDRFEYYHRPTIITSNLSLNEIANIDTRLASRINNKMLIEIKTKLSDYRKQ